MHMATYAQPHLCLLSGLHTLAQNSSKSTAPLPSLSTHILKSLTACKYEAIVARSWKQFVQSRYVGFSLTSFHLDRARVKSDILEVCKVTRSRLVGDQV